MTSVKIKVLCIKNNKKGLEGNVLICQQRSLILLTLFGLNLCVCLLLQLYFDYNSLRKLNYKKGRGTPVCVCINRGEIRRKLFCKILISCVSNSKQDVQHTVSFKNYLWRFPWWSTVAKTLGSQCKGPGFNPWSGNQIPHAATKSSHAALKKRSHMLQRRL